MPVELGFADVFVLYVTSIEITDMHKFSNFQQNSPFSSAKPLQNGDKKNYDDEDNWSVASSYPLKFELFDGLFYTDQILGKLEESLPK